ncbi:MAG: GNAT family N-acetyltransferase [Protaetiibacter sp.]
MAETLTPRRSESESARFGRPTARVSVPDDMPVEVAAPLLHDAISGTTADIVIVRYPSRSLGSLADAAADPAWVCFPGGALVYWEAPGTPASDPSGALELDEGLRRGERAGEIDSALRDSFDGYINHYAADPLIDPQAAVEGYAEWARALAASPENRVFVVEDDGRIVGVAVISADDSGWDINLAGIISSAQRRGHYRRLISGVVEAARRADVRLVISTQSHNIAVQRAWAAEGFRPLRSVDTAHLVRRVALDAPR